MAGTENPFDMSKMAFGGLGQMFDGMEAMKRAWSVFNTSSPLVPTLDVEELDKRIADLKAVEQWLNLNVSMLHGTIQGLEIQRGTLAALKAFGATFDPAAAAGAAANPFAARPQASASPNAGWPSPPPRSTPPATKATRSSRAASDVDSPAAPESPRNPREDAARQRSAAPNKEAAAAPSAPSAAPGIDAGAWWNLLQGTFNQVAQAALSGAGLPGMGGRSAPDAAEPERGAPSSSGSTPRSRTR